jgi:hypothetical protein
MNTLYIYNNSNDKLYPNNSYHIDLYCLNTGKLTGDNIFCINDHKALNDIAKNNSSLYSKFTFKQNSKFISNNLIYKNKLSLYFLSDFSCKRSEIFSTYSDYCNAVFIKNYLENNQIEHVVIDGCEETFLESIQSVIGERTYEVKNLVVKKNRKLYILFKNSIFFLKLMISIIFRNLFVRASKVVTNKNINRLFLTRYPLHLDKNFHEDKYGKLINKDDVYLVSLFTDGLHQNLKLKEYFKFLKHISKSKNIEILDDHLSFLDVLKSFFYSIVLIYKFKTLMKSKYYLNGINLTKNVIYELNFSLIRIPRLLMWENSIERFVSSHQIKKFFYYLHEYSYGRLFTFMFKSFSDSTTLIGFQHGPSSHRKMIYMAAKKELKIDGDGIYSFPTPDEVLSEDDFSKSIYINSGYTNVNLMSKVYRLSYLNKVDRKNSRQNLILVAPGLHDGEYLLQYLQSIIYQDIENNYILKPHPRANNSYISNYAKISNLSIVNDDIHKLLSKVNKVFATYSSIAIEAYILGINVELVEMPGKINESPLIDKKFLKNAENIRY